MKNTLWRVFLMIMVLSIWELSSRLGVLNRLILPAPTTIAMTFVKLISSGELATDIFCSLKRVLFGFFIALGTAIPLGLLIGTNKFAKSVFSPFINFLRPIPPIAWIPLAILWFGIGDQLSYFITAIAAFFPIFLNTVIGAESTSVQHMDVARCFGATKTMILTDVIIPSSMPYILSGVRIGLGFSWMAVVASEMVASFSGLGYLITIGQQMLRSDEVILGMLTIGAIGLLTDMLMVFIKNKLIVWS